jgi:Tol biopolymer transport system component
MPAGQIAFTVGNGDANGIGVVNADGSGYRMLVEPKAIAGQPHGGTEGPAWIGPGRIMFDSNRNGGPDDWHLYTVDVAAGEPVQLTKGADGIENHGSLSRDGTFIAFDKYLPTGNPAEPWAGGSIVVADPDGRHERPVTSTPPGGFDEWPDISPDGQRIAFVRWSGDAGGLYTVNTDGSDLTLIVPAVMQPSRPRWSNDGRRIVLYDNADRFLAQSANVWVVNPDGSGLRQLTFEQRDGQAFYPTWSPDDRFILFVHHRRGASTNDLAVITAEGGAMCTLWAGQPNVLAWESDWAPPADHAGPGATPAP